MYVCLFVFLASSWPHCSNLLHQTAACISESEMMFPLTWLPLSISCHTTPYTQLTHTHKDSFSNSYYLTHSQQPTDPANCFLFFFRQSWWITCPVPPLIKGERGAGHTPGPWQGLIAFIRSLFLSYTSTHQQTHTWLVLKILGTYWANTLYAGTPENQRLSLHAHQYWKYK